MVYVNLSKLLQLIVAILGCPFEVPKREEKLIKAYLGFVALSEHKLSTKSLKGLRKCVLMRRQHRLEDLSWWISLINALKDNLIYPWKRIRCTLFHLYPHAYFVRAWWSLCSQGMGEGKLYYTLLLEVLMLLSTRNIVLSAVLVPTLLTLKLWMNQY